MPEPQPLAHAVESDGADDTGSTARRASWTDAMSPATLPAELAGARRRSRTPGPKDSERQDWRSVVRDALMAEAGIGAREASRYVDIVARHSAGQRLYVPKIDPQRRAERDQQIVLDCMRGMTRRAVAELHECSASHVQRLMSRQAAAAGSCASLAGNGTSDRSRSAHRNRKKTGRTQA